MQFVSTITSKGQVLIPLSLRKELDIKPKDQLIISVVNNTLVATKAPSIDTMFGFIKTKKKLSDEELNRAIDQATQAGMTENL